MEFRLSMHIDGSADLSIKKGFEGAITAMTALASQLNYGTNFQYQGVDRQLALFLSGYGTNNPVGLLFAIMEQQERIVFEIHQGQTNVVLRLSSDTEKLLFLELFFSNGTGFLYKCIIHQ